MFRKRRNSKMESCKRGIFVYIDLIEIANVIVFRVNRHWVIRIVKRSLHELHSHDFLRKCWYL